MWKHPMSKFTRNQQKYVKKSYHVRNWHEYETGLRNRGSLTGWLAVTDGKLANWDARKSGTPRGGRPRKYSNDAIETTVTLGMVLHLASRRKARLAAAKRAPRRRSGNHNAGVKQRRIVRLADRIVQPMVLCASTCPQRRRTVNADRSSRTSSRIRGRLTPLCADHQLVVRSQQVCSCAAGAPQGRCRQLGCHGTGSSGRHKITSSPVFESRFALHSPWHARQGSSGYTHTRVAAWKQAAGRVRHRPSGLAVHAASLSHS